MATLRSARMRPNANPILALARDDDWHDPWGTAMTWAYAVCENLAMVDGEIPNGMGYSPSIAGPILEDWAACEVRDYLMAVPEPGEPTAEERITEVEDAARMLDRYLDWCKAAGRAY